MNLFFNKNYNNKLNNETFTTFRLADETKYEPGAKFKVIQKSGTHPVIFGEYEVIEHRILEQQQINNWMTQLDCATDVSGFKSIMHQCYPNQIDYSTKYSYVLLRKVKKEATQQTLM